MKKYVEASCARCCEQSQEEKGMKANCESCRVFYEEEGPSHTDLIEEQEQRSGKTLDLVQIFNMGIRKINPRR
jgi:hypothetical protein